MYLLRLGSTSLHFDRVCVCVCVCCNGCHYKREIFLMRSEYYTHLWAEGNAWNVVIECTGLAKGQLPVLPLVLSSPLLRKLNIKTGTVLLLTILGLFMEAKLSWDKSTWNSVCIWRLPLQHILLWCFGIFSSWRHDTLLYLHPWQHWSESEQPCEMFS